MSEQNKQTDGCFKCKGHIKDGLCIMCGEPQPIPGRVFSLPSERESRSVFKNNEMSIDEVRSLYFDDNALIEPAYRLFRIDSSSTRYYYTLNGAGKPELFKSTTSFIKDCVPPGDGLLNWLKNTPREIQEKILLESKHYGTLMDICCSRLLIDKKINLDESRILIKGYLQANELYGFDVDLWEKFLKKDIASFAQFVQDYDVQPVAVSIPLISRKRRNAGTLDLVCYMNDRMPTKTIKPKRVLAIVDYKSKIGQFKENGERGSFYAEHELQLHDYKNLLAENFPKLKVKKLFNWSPKNWRGKPSYNLKDQTAAKSAKKLRPYYAILKIDMADAKIFKTVISGTIELSKPVEQNIQTLSLEELVREDF